MLEKSVIGNQQERVRCVCVCVGIVSGECEQAPSKAEVQRKVITLLCSCCGGDGVSFDSVSVSFDVSSVATTKLLLLIEVEAKRRKVSCRR